MKEVQSVPGVRDVAARAGVSIGTVSNVLNRPDKVKAETRKAVRSAMADLSFIPSMAASQLRGKKSHLIGVIVPDVGNLYWASVIRGIESVLEAAGLTMIVASSHQDVFRQAIHLRTMKSQGVDGILIAPVTPPDNSWVDFDSARFGMVLMDSAASPNLPSVGADNVAGAYAAMKHLIELGHMNISFINGPLRIPWCSKRRLGALRAIKNCSSGEICLTEVKVSDLTVEDGARAANMIFKETPSSAIMCVNDMLAMGVLKSARKLGINIPADVSLVGYDDAAFASVVDPPLTTVHQPSYEIGESAGLLLLSNEDRAGEQRELYQPSLVIRGSTGFFRNAAPNEV